MKRHIYVIIFVSLFISIISTIAILIARGYTIDGNVNGILKINSTPDGAKVFLNGKEKGQTPMQIDLGSGSYEISIQKDAYHPWKRIIEMDSAVVNNVYANLFAENKELEQITFTAIDKVFFSPDGSIGIYTVFKDENNPGIWLTKLERNLFELSDKPEKIAEKDLLSPECQQSKEYSITISKQNDQAVLTCNNNDEPTHLLFPLTEGTQKEGRNIDKELGFIPKIITFGIESNTLLISDETFIGLYKTESKEFLYLANLSDSSTKGFSTFGDGYLYITRVGKDIIPYFIDKEGKKNLLIFPKDLIALDDMTQFWSDNNKDVIIYNTENGSYLVNIPSTNNIDLKDKITKVLWAKDGKSVLVTNDQNSTYAIEFISHPDNIFIIKPYEPISDLSTTQDVSWAPNSQQIIISNSDISNIYITEKDKSNQITLFEGTEYKVLSYRLSPSETFLTLLLKDSDTTANLYSVKLRF